MGDERSKEKLIKVMESEITHLFEQALDYAHVACPKDHYPALRSKILRVGNNCIRNLRKRMRHFDVEYLPQAEDLIEVTKK
jgi:hypothetical protein